ncbi:DUF2274 domain-containing protein [Pseudomonas sp. BF-RE-26]|uniref:DUF2274 domain-containing protein n=1 Tax=Pseudomonas sp. BF-RE-26 TaxID=2832396 RepID=UPI001CBCE0DC
MERYTAMYAQVHSEPVDAVAPVPHMLEAFMVRNRAFMRSRSGSIATALHSGEIPSAP